MDSKKKGKQVHNREKRSEKEKKAKKHVGRATINKLLVCDYESSPELFDVFRPN
jgi:hypothetical protein